MITISTDKTLHRARGRFCSYFRTDHEVLFLPAWMTVVQIIVGAYTVASFISTFIL